MSKPATKTNFEAKQLKHFIGNIQSYTLLNVLTDHSLTETVNSLVPKYRESIYPPLETLSMFMSQVLSSDGGCQYIVDKALVEFRMYEFFDNHIVAKPRSSRLVFFLK